MRSTRTRTTIAAATAATALLLLAGCGSNYDDARGKGDAPVAGKHGDDSPKAVTNNPDGFGNIVTGCVHGAVGWRYFATTNAKATASLVVKPDAACK